MNSPSSSFDDQEVEILGRCLDELGTTGDPSAVVARYCARYPELAEQIRGLAAVGQILEETPIWNGGEHGESVGSAPATLPERFGPYQILKQIGRGMAEVYKAKDESLNRLVAVKTIRCDR